MVGSIAFLIIVLFADLLPQFSDHYSYSALVYFLLIKPLLVVFPTIIIIVLFPVCLILFFVLPVYLRAARRWGRWQAGIAVANL